MADRNIDSVPIVHEETDTLSSFSPRDKPWDKHRAVVLQNC